jgi:hypothetical protein
MQHLYGRGQQGIFVSLALANKTLSMNIKVFYLAFSACMILLVLYKTDRPKGVRMISTYVVGGCVVAALAFGIGFLSEGADPVDVLLIRSAADIYPVFLISVAYGMFIRAATGLFDRPEQGRKGE